MKIHWTQPITNQRVTYEVENVDGVVGGANGYTFSTVQDARKAVKLAKELVGFIQSEADAR